MSTRKNVILGLFVLVAVTVLGGYTLFLTDVDLFGATSRMTAAFPGARGLREGDSVLVAGMRAGRVKEVRFDRGAPDDERVVVTLSMDEPVALREGYTIEISESTLLGGRQVAIDPGPGAGDPVRYDDTTVLPGRLGGSPAEAIEKIDLILAENREALREIIENIRSITEDAADGNVGRNIAEAVEGLADAAEDFRSVTRKLASGEGTLGRIIQDDTLYDSYLALAGDGRELIAEAQTGEGAIAALLTDEAIGSSTRQTLFNLEDVTTRAQSGQGVLGGLLYDDAMAEDLAETLANLRTITDRIDRGEGLAGRLISDDAMYEDLRAMVENARLASEEFLEMTRAVTEARGTVGRLVMEDDLYRELEHAIAMLTRSLEDFREAAPVTTFTSVLFGAF